MGVSMSTVLGIVAGAGQGVAEAWPDAYGTGRAGPTLIFSPPASPTEVARRASVTLILLSDEELRAVLSSLRGVIRGDALIVSTCPTVPLSLARVLVGPGPALFRAVVSLGTQPGEGAVALAGEPGAPIEAIDSVKASLSWIGGVEMVAEPALDALSALAPGGAACLCTALEGMEEGAVAEGLTRGIARSFAHHTALATALLLRRHPGSPADLKDQVASPGGTTIAALAVLEDAGVRGAFVRAVERSAGKVRARRDAAGPGVVE
jgi:pyrroline-5-carboxylate reductase